MWPKYLKVQNNYLIVMVEVDGVESADSHMPPIFHIRCWMSEKLLYDSHISC